VRREWEPEELVAAWTLLDDDWELLANKSGANRLGFALMLKFFAIEARFPRHAGEFPKAAVTYVAGLVKVDAAELARYRWSGRPRNGLQPKSAEPASQPMTTLEGSRLTYFPARLRASKRHYVMERSHYAFDSGKAHIIGSLALTADWWRWGAVLMPEF